MSIARFAVNIFVFWGVFLAPAVSVYANESCGSIIQPSDWFNPRSALTTTTISDCDDPFNLTTQIESPYTLFIGDTAVVSGDTVEVSPGGTIEYHIEGDTLLSGYNGYFFLHEGDNYRYVDTSPTEPNEGDYRALAAEFFSAGTDIEPYIATILSGDYYLEDTDMQQQLYAFLDYVDTEYVPVTPALRGGTYTLVIREYELVVTDARTNIIERFCSWILPTAHAEVAGREYTFTITFTLVEKVKEVGASSVLFLPGIQASRLYKDGLLGTEDQLWEPNYNQDVYQLRMNESGESIADVYTRDILDEVFGMRNVYRGFSDFLTGLQSDAVIADWQPFAYDWRYSVVDIAEEGTAYENELKDAVTLIETLAEDSFSDKVTIIGHSNGGLLAKALMVRLEREGKEDLVDRIIFIGTPQLGTPKAIASLLHGYDQQSLLGLIMNAQTVREATRNMSGALGLVPTQMYFDSATEPLVTFDTASGTDFFRTAYGDTINSEAELLSFMSGEGDGRTDEPTTLHEAITVNQPLLTRALAEHRDTLDSWVAPEGVEVIEIVGVGLSTLRGIEYREFIERECTDQDIFGNRTCTERKIYKPFPLFTQYGDETVVAHSAEAYPGEKETYYVNLRAISADERSNAVAHADITEDHSIQAVLTNILKGTTTNVQFVDIQKPETDTDWLLYGVHSPVSLSVADVSGKKVEKGEDRYPVEEIEGSHYFELGDSAYILVPKGGEYKLTLKGAGYGGATFTIDELNGEQQSSLVNVFVATITPSTTIEIVYENEELGNLRIDEDGDGVVDVEMTKDGAIVSKTVTYEDLKRAIRNLSLAPAFKVSLLLLAGAAEEFDKKSTRHAKWSSLELLTLNQLEATVKLYVKKKLLTQSHANTILEISNKLKI